MSNPNSILVAPGRINAGSASRTLLKDLAYRQLKEAIQSGQFPAGMFLSERQLVDRFQMSKTPIRSALEHLESQGLVAVSPQQGIVVRDLTLREIVELFDVRTALEPFVASSLARRKLDAERRARLEENIEAQQAAAEDCDALTATGLDVEFHSLLAEFLDNHEIITWTTRCFDKLYRGIARINRQAPDRLMPSCREHASIVQAILEGQADAAAQEMIDHLRYGKQYLVSS